MSRSNARNSPLPSEGHRQECSREEIGKGGLDGGVWDSQHGFSQSEMPGDLHGVPGQNGEVDRDQSGWPKHCSRGRQGPVPDVGSDVFRRRRSFKGAVHDGSNAFQMATVSVSQADVAPSVEAKPSRLAEVGAAPVQAASPMGGCLFDGRAHDGARHGGGSVDDAPGVCDVSQAR